MARQKEFEKFRTGKMISRDFSKRGSLVSETHMYPNFAIWLVYDFEAGRRIAETYYVKKRLVSRRTYERKRAAYPDMPAADEKLSGDNDWLVRRIAKERRQHKQELKEHRPNRDAARELDRFCYAMMKTGKGEDAGTWIKNRNHTLGELGRPASRRLVTRLLKLGCVHVCACKIECRDDAAENTGHLVVELPRESKAREKILKFIGILASKQGYRGPLDEGQRFAYVKLD